MSSTRIRSRLQIEARPSCLSAGLDLFPGTPAGGDFFGYRHVTPFCCPAPDKETMLRYSQPAFYRAANAIRAEDAAALMAILARNPRLRDPHASECCLPFVDGQCHADYPAFVAGCCCPFVLPGVSAESFLRQSNPAVHRAIRAIRKGDAIALARAAKGQGPDFGAQGTVPSPRPLPEMPCKDVDCWDCTCFGADRCEGAPRRCCGDSWLHAPFLCFIPMFRYSQPWEYRGGGATVRDLAVRAFGTEVATAALQPEDGGTAADMPATGVVVLKTLGGSSYEVLCRPGPNRIADIAAAAQQQHADLRGDQIELKPVVTVVTEQPKKPAPVPAPKVLWTAHANQDMCRQGDVEIIKDWKSKHSIDDLKRMVVERGYSGFSIGNFGHAALKRFNYQLTVDHCKPASGYTCTIHIYHRDGATTGSTSVVPAGGRQPGPGSRWNAALVDITDPAVFAFEKLKTIEENQREICFARFDSFDLCFGADRCEGGRPRRCCGDQWVHPPPCLCCLPTLRMPLKIHRYVPSDDGQSIVELARQSKNPAVVQAVAGQELVFAKVAGADGAPIELIATFVAPSISTTCAAQPPMHAQEGFG